MRKILIFRVQVDTPTKIPPALLFTENSDIYL